MYKLAIPRAPKTHYGYILTSPMLDAVVLGGSESEVKDLFEQYVVEQYSDDEFAIIAVIWPPENVMKVAHSSTENGLQTTVYPFAITTGDIVQ